MTLDERSPLTFDQFEKSQYYAHAPHVDPITYNILGLAGEVGELVEAFKKMVRFNPPEALLQQDEEKLIDELGDILWYASKLAAELGISFESVARGNMRKLAHRAIHGKVSK